MVISQRELRRLLKECVEHLNFHDMDGSYTTPPELLAKLAVAIDVLKIEVPDNEIGDDFIYGFQI